MALNDRIKAAMAEMHAEYLVALPAKLERLAGLVAEAEAEHSRARLDAARTEAHRMHGTAGSYGFPEVGKTAARIELALERITKAPDAPSEEEWAEITSALAELRRIVSEAR